MLIFEHTAEDGKNYKVQYYNLDMIISVGYRVNSKRGIMFRKWATAILKEYIKIESEFLKEENKVI
jgi:DNA ligase (NAD+)